MKNITDTLSRLQRIVPSGIQPKFRNAAEWREWQDAEGRKRSAEIDQANQKVRLEKILGRSGIQELHRNCSFSNYETAGEAQKKALAKARKYAAGFGEGFASFVFSGNPGTGKNHLAAAIGNHLLFQGRSVLVVTIPDLSLRVRECYDGTSSETLLIDGLCRVDLLVLDDVGVQRESRAEWVLLNQIIDRRLSAMKPVGILTNLTYDELKQLLGPRIMDRLTMDGGLWVNFTWGSYRQNVTHLRVVK